MRGQAVLGPRCWSPSHCEVSLRLVQLSQGLGVPPWHVSNLDRRPLPSANRYLGTLVKGLLKKAKPAIPSYIESNGASSPSIKSETRRRLHVDGPRRLSPEQAEVVELAAKGHNIFYTGSAGCGKSTVLRAMVQRLDHMGKRVKVLAPTGRAALAINGTTTWTFAGWNPNSHKLGIEQLRAMAKRKKGTVRRRFRRTDVVIIDEISMVENLHLERLNQVMKAARHKPGYPAQQYPFGGVQVIVTGDFAQLPPVRPFRHCIDCGSEMQIDENEETEEETYHCRRCNITHHDSEKWAFQSKAWEECNFTYVYLDKIHRQRDTDFISLLNKCRLGEPFTPEEVNILMNHKTKTTGAVELYATREEVRLVNERGFRKLVAKSHSYQTRDTFVWNREDHPHLEGRRERHADGSLKSLDEHSMDRLVELKCGMPVVLLVNLDLDHGLCNGSQGVIVAWTSGETMSSPSSGDNDHVDLREIEITTFKETLNEPVWPVVRFSNGIERAIGPECQVNELGDDKPYSLLCRTQIPLTPAWALSIHRAQGMTLDKVKVDVSKAFADGQVYVALSRVTSLQGLEVVGNARGLAVGVGGNKDVRLFYKNKFGR